LRALLSGLRGRKVLDLGCGFGWFCRWARQQGAAHVLGIDVSERMLARCRAATADRAITYTRADMEQLELPADSFDLVYSSLALHYVENLSGLMSQAYHSLARWWGFGLFRGAPYCHCSRRTGLVAQCGGSQDLAR
jgi:ubiquinone/menaquinone biosynthesis C-methylase UbiE